jgi:NAD(P)H-quinone oxidoreductase subunit 5
VTALLAAAIVIRTALMPVHGWLIQVMEAPTPVSALLHAGVVNLGGFWLIRFSPLIEQAHWLRWTLVIWGLATAALAGLVMLTRVSIKVRLAWSTVAQMGFMVMECGLGLYSLAALHMIGHSLYKAHQFLASASIVRQFRIRQLHTLERPGTASMLIAPVFATTTVLIVQASFSTHALPWWWTALLGLAWAPLLWVPDSSRLTTPSLIYSVALGLVATMGLAAASTAAHVLMIDLHDRPDPAMGYVALAGMAILYLAQARISARAGAMEAWRRWSYAGYYIDEHFTRAALYLWPSGWQASKTNKSRHAKPHLVAVHAR